MDSSIFYTNLISNPHSFDESYYGKNCQECFISENTRLCASCKTVAYCSKSHQIENWSKHQPICKALRKANIKVKKYEIGCSFENWSIYRDALLAEVTRELLTTVGNIPSYVSEICKFPRVCSVCYQKENLIWCNKCLVVSYCSVEHKDQDKIEHEMHCYNLKLCKAFDAKYFSHVQRAITNFYHFVLEVIPNSVKAFPTTLRQLVCIIQKQNKGTGDVEDIVKFVLFGDTFASPGTIIFALEKIKFIKRRLFTTKPPMTLCEKYMRRYTREILATQDKNCMLHTDHTLIIHVVGVIPEDTYLFHHNFCKLLLHWISNIDYVELHFICTKLDEQLSYFNSDLQATLKCHVTDYKRVSNILAIPDLVAVFQVDQQCVNPDFKDKKSLQNLVRHDRVPLLLSGRDEQQLTSIVDILSSIDDVSVKVHVQENPFAELRPFRKWDQKSMSTYTKNKYFAVLMREE